MRFINLCLPISWWLHYFQLFVPRLTFERKRRIGWAVVGCVGRIRSSPVSTRRRNMVYSSINILRHIFSSSFSSFLPCFLSSSLLLPTAPTPPRHDICLFKGRNNHSSSIRRRELDLIILKRTWKAEVVTVCWYWIGTVTMAMPHSLCFVWAHAPMAMELCFLATQF